MTNSIVFAKMGEGPEDTIFLIVLMMMLST